VRIPEPDGLGGQTDLWCAETLAQLGDEEGDEAEGADGMNASSL
jgi:hypothetical protein